MRARPIDQAKHTSMPYSASLALLGITLAAAIVFLLRRDQLYLRDALFWLATAAASLVLALLPRLIDLIGHVAGVAYPPALLLGLACAFLTVKGLLSDIALTELRRDVRRLNQRVALVDAEQTAERQIARGGASLHTDLPGNTSINLPG